MRRTITTIKRLAVLACLCVSSCEASVEISREKIREESKTVACTYVGYCFTCGLKPDGEVGCGLALGPCGGHQPVRISVESVKYRYESEPENVFEREESRVIEKLKPCR